MLSNYKRKFFSPYERSDLPAIIFTFIIIFGLFFTVFTMRQDTNVRSNAQSANSVEPENGTLAGNITVVNDANASGGKYVQFGTVALSPTPTPSITGIIDFRGDWETGDSSQYGSLECANPSRQFQIVMNPVRQGKYAGRFEEAPGDVWGNGSIRCLAANYGDFLHEGSDTYYAFSLYIPQKLSYNRLWELHMRAEIYSVDPNTSVAPYGVDVYPDGSMKFGILTGPAFWNGSNWTGWSHYEPDLSLGTDLDNYPTNTWIDFIIHIKGTESNAGVVEVWHRIGNNPWPTTPQLSRANIPTLQWIPGYNNEVFGHKNDPNVPNDIHTTSDYIELGLYHAAGTISSTDVIYQDGFRQGSSFAAVKAEFP